MRSPLYSILPVSLILFVGAAAGVAADPKPTLEDLKKLEIICFAPAYLPKGFHLTKVEVTQEEGGPSEGGRKFPIYSLEYAGPGEASFFIESAREGIGDRNLMSTDDTDEKALQSPLFGEVDIIYTPKGATGIKKEIIANWVKDQNMVAETKIKEDAHPVLGRFHGFTATGMTVEEFEKIIASLKPVTESKKDEAGIKK